MRIKILLKPLAVFLALVSMLASAELLAQDKYYIPSNKEPNLPDSVKAELLRNKIKYVFVLYQENRSFDSYFGTFPGAEGLYSHPAAQTPGFTQQLVDTNGSLINVQPLRKARAAGCDRAIPRLPAASW